jgi:hypothetical protein
MSELLRKLGDLFFNSIPTSLLLVAVWLAYRTIVHAKLTDVSQTPKRVIGTGYPSFAKLLAVITFALPTPCHFKAKKASLTPCTVGHIRLWALSGACGIANA